jgi:hypothetical protein
MQLIVWALVPLVLLSPARAAVFTIPAGDVAALIHAINTANGNGEDDTITLEAGAYTLTAVDNDTDGNNGLPSITSGIILQGAGADRTSLRRDSTDANAPRFRILHIAATGHLTLHGVTITGGRVGAPGPLLDVNGGGIFNAGILTLTNSSVNDNATDVFGEGGGIFNAGTLTLSHSAVSGNIARLGSGISNREGTVELTHSTISNNTATTIPGLSSFAGGIDNVGGRVSLTHSTVSSNMADVGGGMRNFDGTLELTHSTVSGNTAANIGGGIENDAGGVVTLTHSTVSGNTADLVHGDGGGICNGCIFGGTSLTLIHSTVSDNTAAFGGGINNFGVTLTLTHTIIAGNSQATDTIPDDCQGFGTLLSLGHNLVGAGTGCPSDGPGDLTVDPAAVFTTVLGPLQHNGGATQTHALLPGSPAIDAGDAVCTDAHGAPHTTDQRGKPRPVDGNGDGTPACDIGAFEFFPIVNDLVALAPGLRTAFDPRPVPGGPAGTFTITATFTNTSNTPLRFPFFGVGQLTGGNLLLNADAGPGDVGATLTPKVAGNVLAPGASVTAEFVIGLQRRERFTFLVDAFGEPQL